MPYSFRRFTPRPYLLLAAALSCVLAVIAYGRSPARIPVQFSITVDVGFGNSVFVVGDHPDLGGWDVTRALKLRFTSGNVWIGEIAVQAGTDFQFRYLKRSTAQENWCNSANAVYLTGILSQSIAPEPPAPYNGKTIYYLSGWSAASLVYHTGGGNFAGLPMIRVGDGRTAGESLFKISGVGEAGENFEFVFTDNNNHWDNPSGGGNYLTALDVFWLQDGNIFSYSPPAVLSAPHVLAPHLVNSSVPNIAARNVRVCLPRGYDQNLGRRYPVVYFEDGQNVFDPSTAFGGVEWQADETANREISQGRMREAILVGVDNTAARIPEYQPPNDSYQGTPGRADAYANFLINNVRPYIDNAFRTLNDPKNTVTIGSSMGGLVSLYLGREYTTFGKIAVMSPALWISPNYMAQVNAGFKKSVRVHLDMGTAEGQSDFDNCLAMYDTHLNQGFVTNGDVEFVAGCGQQHNEMAWAARLPMVLDFLLPSREDPPELALRDFPPRLSVGVLDLPNQSVTLNYPALFGFNYALSRSSDFKSWSPVSMSTETQPWAQRSTGDNGFAPTGPVFWRLQATLSP
ncbi:MAG: alpha/beta hydrolase-fold protein [Chthoniobacterales bacterium]